jgi:hypothetical protein
LVNYAVGDGLMQRRHCAELPYMASVGQAMEYIRTNNIPDTASLNGWDDGHVTLTWWAEETPEEERDRRNREAVAAVQRERRGY